MPKRLIKQWSKFLCLLFFSFTRKIQFGQRGVIFQCLCDYFQSFYSSLPFSLKTSFLHPEVKQCIINSQFKDSDVRAVLVLSNSPTAHTPLSSILLSAKLFLSLCSFIVDDDEPINNSDSIELMWNLPSVLHKS